MCCGVPLGEKGFREDWPGWGRGLVVSSSFSARMFVRRSLARPRMWIAGQKPQAVGTADDDDGGICSDRGDLGQLGNCGYVFVVSTVQRSP